MAANAASGWDDEILDLRLRLAGQEAMLAAVKHGHQAMLPAVKQEQHDHMPAENGQ